MLAVVGFAVAVGAVVRVGLVVAVVVVVGTVVLVATGVPIEVFVGCPVGVLVIPRLLKEPVAVSSFNLRV